MTLEEREASFLSNIYY